MAELNKLVVIEGPVMALQRMAKRLRQNEMWGLALGLERARRETCVVARVQSFPENSG